MATTDSIAPKANEPSAVSKKVEKLPKLPTPAQVLLKLFLHSIAMFTLPIATYYLSKNYVEEEHGVKPPQSYIYAAIAAVVVIQAVIFCYVYQAFKEEQLERKIKAASKQD
ncbi:vacuolar ATPase assembly integral membrane protein vma21-like [Penaeus japonicus]|uniref:vacuolar ATPase assembly integral membrane protein vma21-like n=1 Tax=Penaeus japonicus TaxID=27405 RepID=UPI001C716A42|nr:vacuolar ATPase assembly integral membrane protein vma21-like [Penaeus japonicus]XP_042863036.1 vacuolar ATPase assembly integral membrane protein vma21-like [Penaeus japonicus]